MRPTSLSSRATCFRASPCATPLSWPSRRAAMSGGPSPKRDCSPVPPLTRTTVGGCGGGSCPVSGNANRAAVAPGGQKPAATGMTRSPNSSSGVMASTLATWPCTCETPSAARFAEPFQGRVDTLAIRAKVERHHHGLGDLVVVAADRLAVPAQHIELAGQVGAGEQVAGLSVLSDQPQRFALAAAADQDRRVRAGERLRRVQGALKTVMLAGIRAVGIAPHLQADLQGLFEPLEPLSGGRECQPKPVCLIGIPGGADAEPGPAA